MCTSLALTLCAREQPNRSTIRKPRHPLSSAHSEQLQTLHGYANLTFRDRTRRRNPRHPPRVPEQCRARACRGSTAPPAPRVSLVRPLSPEPTILRPIAPELTRFAALALPRLADATFFFFIPTSKPRLQAGCMRYRHVRTERSLLPVQGQRHGPRLARRKEPEPAHRRNGRRTR